jgi:hypothetical protein
MWNEFLVHLLESRKFLEEVEKEKEIFADAIINVEKLVDNPESKPSIDMIIKKFINFL